MNLRSKKTILVIIFAAILCYGGWFLNKVLWTPGKTELTGDVEILIDKGMGLYDVAYTLNEKKLIDDVKAFRWAAWFLRVERKIQPGYFKLSYGLTNHEILTQLQNGGILTKNVTIPEGLTIKHIAGLLQQELSLDSSHFVNLCEDSSFAAELGVKVNRLEGYLFPETYNFYIETDEETVIRKMVSQFFSIFSDTLRSELSKYNFTLHDAVTMASIIQGEIMLKEEAQLVSAVYHNRLRKRMLLAADPSIQYIIPDGPRRLLNKDLRIDSPYNTYRRRGLPPGPINNPGRTALWASVNPADADYIYMVAWGDGSHAFNVTPSGHERDKTNLRKARRKIAREKRDR